MLLCFNNLELNFTDAFSQYQNVLFLPSGKNGTHGDGLLADTITVNGLLMVEADQNVKMFLNSFWGLLDTTLFCLFLIRTWCLS